MTTTPEKTSKKSAARSASTGMSADERAAMKERAAELRTAGKRAKAADKAAAEATHPIDHAFTTAGTLDDDFQLIPIPGHTPGATAFLWDSGEHRMLFTGDSLYLRDGEWIVAVLEDSDREAYIESLKHIATLDFDVLVPWAASKDGPYYALTDRADTRRRIDAILERI